MNLQQKVVDAMCKEVALRSSEINEPIQTIYFGGGSPSILEEKNLRALIEALRDHFDLNHLQEFTLESNPDDHSEAQLQLWKSLGVNRLSIGIQSFRDEDLNLMNRAHDSKAAIECIQTARSLGFEVFTLDLIYGIPNQTLASWRANINQAISLNPQHISAYCLTIEEKTVLHHQIQKGKLHEKSEEEIMTEYQVLCNMLAEAGYVHYEVSNFAMPGHEAKHNAAYWSGSPYIGIGPSAHSFDGHLTRRWNVANNPRYIKLLEEYDGFFETESLSSTDRFNEQIMTGLRTAKGIDIGSWPVAERDITIRQAVRMKKANLIQIDGMRISIPESRWLMSDHIIRELLLV